MEMPGFFIMLSNYSKFVKSRYVSLGLAFLINSALGSVYSYGVFRPALEKYWSLGAFDSGLPYTLFLASFALAMPFGGALIEKSGEKKAIIFGAAFLGAGWVLAGFSGNIQSLSLFYGLMGGVGVGFAYGAPLSMAAKLFPDRKGLAMGVPLAGFGMSPLFSAPLMRWAIETAGPVRGFAYAGIVLAAVVIALSLLLRRPPAHPHAHTTLGQASLPDHDYNSREMLGSPRFYALWLSFSVACAIGLSVIGITSSFAIEVVGMNPASTTALLMFFSVFNALGRPIFGYLSDRAGPGIAGAVSFLLVFCAAAALYLFPASLPVFTVAFAFLWLNLGAWLAVAPAATAFFFGLGHQPRNYGIVYTAYGAGAIAGVSLVSYIREATSSYSSVLAPMAATALALAFFSLLTLSRKKTLPRKSRIHRTRGEALAGRPAD